MLNGGGDYCPTSKKLSYLYEVGDAGRARHIWLAQLPLAPFTQLCTSYSLPHLSLILAP